MLPPQRLRQKRAAISWTIGHNERYPVITIYPKRPQRFYGTLNLLEQAAVGQNRGLGMR